MLAPILALAIGATPQDGWQGRRTVDEAVAYVVAEALPHSDYGSMEWSYFGAGAGDGVYWHLSGPKPDIDILLPGVTRRRGWVETRGSQVSLAACGDEDRIHSLAIRIPGWNHEPILAALAGRDLTVEETWRRGRAASGLYEERAVLPSRPLGEDGPPRYVEWRVSRPNHAPGVLSAEFRCTRPGTRSARRCWTDWTLVFRADFTARAAQPEPLERCTVGGRE